MSDRISEIKDWAEHDEETHSNGCHTTAVQGILNARYLLAELNKRDRRISDLRQSLSDACECPPKKQWGHPRIKCWACEALEADDRAAKA